MKTSNNLESLLMIPLKLLGKRASRCIIKFLLRIPYNNNLNKIIRLLLNNIEDGPIKTRNGFIMHFNHFGHSTVLRKDLIIGAHERFYLKMIRKLISPSDYVIDIGGHEGYFSLFMASIVGKEGKVFSIEPNKENVSFLKHNIQYNNANIQVIEKAVSNEKKEGEFIYDVGMGAWGSLVNFDHFNSQFENKKSIKVKVDTLDNIFQDFEGKIRFMKVDTEGNELNVFLGAKKFLLKHRPIVCFEVSMFFWSHLDCSIDTMFKFFKDNEYELFVLKKDGLHKFNYLSEQLIDMFAIPKPIEKELYESGIIIQSFD